MRGIAEVRVKMGLVARARRSPTARDLVLSLVVLMIPVAIVVAIMNSGPSKPPVKAIDWQAVAQQARQQSPFEIMTPSALPKGWTATRASWTKVGQPDPTGTESPRNRWQLGVLTGDQIYIELDQVDKLPQEFLASATNNGSADGRMDISGQSWQRLDSEDDRTKSLVRVASGVTTVVSGDTSYQLLGTFAALLQTAS